MVCTCRGCVVGTSKVYYYCRMTNAPRRRIAGLTKRIVGSNGWPLGCENWDKIPTRFEWVSLLDGCAEWGALYANPLAHFQRLLTYANVGTGGYCLSNFITSGSTAFL